ncbi:MAG: AAA family ATPase [Acidiferrobacterales bacterium]|nr:AAA family ATPase [Acidiferrobacterales bacterium]
MNDDRISSTEEPSENFAIENAKQVLDQLQNRVSRRFIGQEDVIKSVIIALLSNGHVLLEGVPGLGKTLLVKLIANSFDGLYQRIQFTPDLMPADVTGHALYDMKEGEFHTRKGPVFTNLLLADEINRAPAKTQAALLEVMQERQVTIDGESLPAPDPFMVLATQNPIEQEGTYSLPEAELDRFLMKIKIDYPSHDNEVLLTEKVTQTMEDDLGRKSEAPLIDRAGVKQLQSVAASLTFDRSVLDYAVRIVRATRDSRALLRGAGPRASIALLRCARASALMRGASWVVPEDVKNLGISVLRHRVALAPEIEIQGMDIDGVLKGIIETVDAPRA